MTRFTSRAWKRNAIRPPGSFSTAAWRATVHVPDERPLVEAQRRERVRVRLVERGVTS